MDAQERMPRYQPLMVSAVMWSAGLVADRYVEVSIAAWLAGFWSSLATWFCCWCRGKRKSGSAGLCLAILCLGAAWHARSWRWFANDEVGHLVTREKRGMLVELTAITSPRWLPAPVPDPLQAVQLGERSRFEAQITMVRTKAGWRAASGRTIVNVNGQLVGVRVGDRLRVVGLVSRIDGPSNPGEFDYAAPARGERRLVRMHLESPQAVLAVVHGKSHRLSRWINDFRAFGERQLRKHVPAEQAGLAVAMLLGSREWLDESMNERFFVNGLSHLIAISGLNVAIFAYGFWLVARVGLFSRKWALTMAILLAIVYALVTDSKAPVVRAALLVVCLCWAQFQGRRNLAFNSLAAALMLVTAIQPAALFLVGTQLSFMAVAVLCLQSMQHQGRTADPLDRLIDRSRPWPIRLLRSGVVELGYWLRTSVNVWAVTLPLVWYHFCLLSPIALLLSPFVMLPMALSLYAGFGVLVGSLISDSLATSCGVVCAGGLNLIDQILRWGQSLPGGHVWLPPPAAGWVLAIYAGLTTWSVFPALRPTRRWLAAVLLVTAVLGVASAGLLPEQLSGRLFGRLFGRNDRSLKCTFLSVGHGTAVLLLLPNGRTILYDAGHLGTPRSAVHSISACLWTNGVTHLDAVVLSHADIDHFNALPGLLDRFSVGVVYVGPTMWLNESPPVDLLHRSLISKGIRLRQLVDGDSFTVAGGPSGEAVRFHAMHPPLAGVAGNDNANSIVLSVEHADRRILLPGDLEAAGMNRLLATPRKHWDVVMAPHHGSLQADPAAFISWSTPSWVIVSCAHRGDSQTVRDILGFYGAEVHTTRADGAVTVVIQPGSIEVSSFRRKLDGG